MSFIEKFKKRSFLLVIRVKAEGLKFPIIIPIPLPLVEDILTSILTLGRFGFKILPMVQKKFANKNFDFNHDFRFNQYFDFNFLSGTMALSDMMNVLIELIHELQYLGQFTLVEVKDGDTHVSIKFY